MEAGFFIGQEKPLYILLDDEPRPELLYALATALYTTIEDFLEDISFD
jgi:hypothetical protein